MTLPTDEVIPVKLAFKAKMNTHIGLDKRKASICLLFKKNIPISGDQTKEQNNHFLI